MTGNLSQLDDPCGLRDEAPADKLLQLLGDKSVRLLASSCAARASLALGVVPSSFVGAGSTLQRYARNVLIVLSIQRRRAVHTKKSLVVQNALTDVSLIIRRIITQPYTSSHRCLCTPPFTEHCIP